MADTHPIHHSYWYEGSPAGRYPRLDGELEVDVVIVGAGITGLTTALQLQRYGARVAVLERNHVGAGTSGRTTAHLTSMVDSEYTVLEQRFGLQETRLVGGSMASAILRVEGFVHELGIDCDFKRVPGYYYTESPSDLDILEDEFQACLRAGLEVEWCDTIPLPFRTAGGFVALNQAEFQPIRYLDALAHSLNEAGTPVFEQSGVIAFEDGEPCVVRTEHGVVRAGHVVLATHTPLGRSALHTALPPYRSYVLAAKTREPLPDALFWDTAEPYNYLRRHQGPHGDVLIVGGKDHKTAHGGTENDSYEALEAYVRQRFEVESILHRWSAQFYEPVDGLPFIGRYPRYEHIYVATGFSGDGMTFGTLAGLLLADELTARPNPYAELFRPTRINARAGAREFVKENLDVAWRFVWDRFTAAQKRQVSELEPGHGCVIRSGHHPAAVYRQPDGQLHTMSAVCPHLHCVVHWNLAEQTWDCPCHGARFNTEGRVLEGPPLQGLKRFDDD